MIPFVGNTQTGVGKEIVKTSPSVFCSSDICEDAWVKVFGFLSKGDILSCLQTTSKNADWQTALCTAIKGDITESCVS